MILISVDPGYGRAGMAVLEQTGGKQTLLHSVCVETSASLSFEKRLIEVGSVFEKLIKQYKPEAFAMESLYFSTNKKTALAVAETRGAFKYIAAVHNLRVTELNPMTVKSALSAGDKRQMMKMVELLLKLPKKKRLDDEYDAIAVGLAFLALNGKIS